MAGVVKLVMCVKLCLLGVVLSLLSSGGYVMISKERF